MKKITAGQIINAIGGELFAGDVNAVVTGVEMDSRIMKDGDCFFALPGERVDGNDFIAAAFEKGACCAVATNKEKAETALEKYPERTIIITDDSEKALRDLAKWYMGTFDDIRRIAVTGSNGKTTTKDMIHAICSAKYRTQKTPVNRNNLIGLPLTVLSLEEDTEVAVFELGMDAFNEIRTMAEIVKPEVAVITNVGTAHVERLGSREGILKAKLEITEFLEPENVLIIPDGGDVLTREKAAGNYKLLSAGAGGKNEYIISDVENHGEEGMTFSLEYDGGYNKFELLVPGEYNVSNASLAIAAASVIGVSPEEAARGLLDFKPAEKRMNIRGVRGIKVIDDTYNASPPAMKAAIDVLMHTGGIRKAVILGDMFELGEESEKYHREVGNYAAQAGVQLFIGV
ncbi:MAG: UDP-N-acetylmuramoyl-tripeptide--D-alanyl-D-alanine ligase, partial [Firmicutes bacterium]|nr:UDP-N-acetylmuramoyl-tripeptide--D-alanyl-D-alanine ligase [Bacillota bacterium]